MFPDTGRPERSPQCKPSPQALVRDHAIPPRIAVTARLSGVERHA